MGEAVAAPRRDRLRHDARFDCLVDRFHERRLGEVTQERTQRLEPELAADHGSGREHSIAVLRQTLEPSPNGVPDALRNAHVDVRVTR